MSGKLVALVDGSDYSRSVCEHAAWLATRSGRSVVGPGLPGFITELDVVARTSCRGGACHVCSDARTTR